MDISIKGMRKNYQFILCKMNGTPLGIIPNVVIDSIKRGIDTVSEITFTVKKYYGADRRRNILYDELENERYIKLDEEEMYVIKKIVEENEEIKTVTAYSREKKLYKIQAEFEDISITLKTPFEDIADCYDLNTLLYTDTGWTLGYISDSVLYRANETIIDILSGNKDVTLSNEEKLRYQESVDTNWYDYIKNDISEQFECYPIFDSYNKTVNLYSDDELGGKLNLILSYDNYLKKLEKTSDTEEIITRLTLTGNSDLTVLECNPTGNRYIENFSYFIEKGEMSKELIDALAIYDEIVAERTIKWNEARNEKMIKDELYNSKQTDLKFVYSKIKSLELAIDLAKDEGYKAELREEMMKEIDKKNVLEPEIDELYKEIKLIEENILNLNKLCKKEYATDSEGNLIFTSEMLNELKEFIYQNSYTNEGLTKAEDLMKVGIRQLEEMCHPTFTWAIDSVNFIEKLETTPFRQQWKGELSLGDRIVLKGNDVVEEIYLIGYTQNLRDGSLTLELSNKKSTKEFSLAIGKRLTQATEAWDKLKRTKYILTNAKLNRLGVQYDKVNKTLK